MQPQPQAKVARVPRARGDECMAQGDGQRVCGPRVKRTGVQPQANAARVWQAMGDGYPVSGEGGGHAALGEGSGRADLGEGGGRAAPGEGDGLAAPAPGEGGEGDKGYERRVHGPRPRRRACGPRVKRTGVQPHATPRECGSSHSGISGCSCQARVEGPVKPDPCRCLAPQTFIELGNVYLLAIFGHFLFVKLFFFRTPDPPPLPTSGSGSAFRHPLDAVAISAFLVRVRVPSRTVPRTVLFLMFFVCVDPI
jgi:hypothetical protein